MPKFRLVFPVEQAGGTQTYEIEATDAAAALRKWKTGSHECVHEEIEVEKLGEPEIEEIPAEPR